MACAGSAPYGMAADAGARAALEPQKLPGRRQYLSIDAFIYSKRKIHPYPSGKIQWAVS